MKVQFLLFLYFPDFSRNNLNKTNTWKDLRRRSTINQYFKGVMNGYFPTLFVQGPMWRCVCIINSYSTLLNWLIVSLLILFILFSNVCYIVVHDYILSFTGSPCCSVSYYYYTSLRPYYKVIHYGKDVYKHVFVIAISILTSKRELFQYWKRHLWLHSSS